MAEKNDDSSPLIVELSPKINPGKKGPLRKEGTGCDAITQIRRKIR